MLVAFIIKGGRGAKPSDGLTQSQAVTRLEGFKFLQFY